MRGILLLTLAAVVFASEDCGENEHFESCGTACPLTCENYDDPPLFCVKRCDIGCHCDTGYVRASDGRCVRPEECPSSGPIPKEQNCEDEPEGGMCLAYFPMWYYDASARTCREFVYGGCQGNGNRYNSEAECMEKCARRSAPSACLQEKKVGPCKAGFSRFYYNKETGNCEEFTYGGCQGNSNNFGSQEDCEAVCKD